MGFVLLVLLLILLLGAFGFAIHGLWTLAVIIAVIWAIGWLVRPGGGRWYYW